MKKFMSLILVLVMTLSLAACQGGENDVDKPAAAKQKEATSSSSSSKGSESMAEEGIDTSEHVVIKYLITGNKPSNGRNEEMFDKLNAILTEKVNAELEIYWIEWTDYLTNYNLTLAANDGTVDLVGTATDWLDAWPNAKKGAFLEMDEDMLATYAPMTYEQVPDEYWEMCKYDGSIYLMPEDNYAQWINHGFMYREDWAEDLGVGKVDSWSDLGDYFAAVKKAYPDMVPFDVGGSTGAASTLAGGWILSNTDNVIIEGLDVPMFFGTKDDFYTIESPYMEGDELLDFAKNMKAWSDAGYWREDVLNFSGDNRELFYAGKTATAQHHTETWSGADYKLQDKGAGEGARSDFFYFGDESKNLTKMSITHGATAVTASSENPERALMVYDLIRNDEELYMLFNFGIEGLQYEIADNGLMTRPEGFDSDKDSIQTNYWWGRNDDFHVKSVEVNVEDLSALAEEYESFAIDYPYGQLIFDTQSISSYLSNMSNVYSTYMPLMAYGKTDDPVAMVEEFRSAMISAGYDKVMVELQAQMDAFKASVAQ